MDMKLKKPKRNFFYAVIFACLVKYFYRIFVVILKKIVTCIL